MKILISKAVELPPYPCYMEDDKGDLYFIFGRSSGSKVAPLEGFEIKKNGNGDFIYGDYIANIEADSVHVFKGIITIEQ